MSAWSTLSRRAAVALLLVALLPHSTSAYMKILRQGQDSVENPNSDDGHGRALAFGDFDGDGYEDLAVAAPQESNSLINAAIHGGVAVSYGSAAGLTHVGADWLTVGDLGTDTVRYGRALASADFDQDGYDDLAVGLPYLDLPLVSAEDAGQVWIHRGGEMGLSANPAVILDQEDVAGAGSEDGDLFGFALCTGFFDDDSHPDLAVGAIGEDSEAGGVYYFYSDGSGITTTGSGFVGQAQLGESPVENGAWVGYALTASDFDGNGTEDLAIGAPRKSVLGLGDAGRVYVLYSTSSGLDVAFVDAYDTDSLGLDLEGDAWFGAALTAGNYWTQKPTHDLAIGEPQFDQSGQIDAGRAIVLRFDPLPTKGPGKAIVPADINILRQSVNGNESAEAGDQFGYALASGNYTGDDLDDIAVGAPFEDVSYPGLGNLFFSGRITVYEGWPSGPTAWQDYFRVLDVNTENDHATGGETFGFALAFGAVDDSGYEALAIGAPNRDFESYLDGGTDISDAGAVYVSAPWRQPVDRPHRSSAVYDCAQNLVYAQRPLDLVNPASTTKAMTLLLACEAIESGFVSETYPYVVDWARPPNIGGSLVPLYFGETMEFHNLMKTMMTVSGNDAGYALGDVMTGEVAVWDEYETTLGDFADLMNTRADQLGLSVSTFMNNPSGMDYGTDPHHRTHALDWVRLAHGVMQNDCARDIVIEDCWEVPRDLAGDLQNWLAVDVDIQTTFCNGFVNGLQGGGFPATGVKGGSTPSAWRTGLGSATALGGEAHAAWFGVRKKDEPEGAPGGSNSGTGRDLLAVGRAACEPGFVAPPDPPPPLPFGTMENVSTQLGNARGTCFALSEQEDPDVDPRDVTLSVVAQPSNPGPVSYHLGILRTSAAEVRPSEELSFGYEEIESTEGVEIQNMGDDPVFLTVTASHPAGATWTLELAGGATTTLGANAVGGAAYTWTLTNDSRDGIAQLGIHHLGLFAAGQAGDGTALPSTDSMGMTTTGAVLTADQMCVYLGGQDSSGAGIVGVSVHTAGTPTAIDPDVPSGPRATSELRLMANVPNPFNPSTSLRFELSSPRRIDLRIYDLAGRLVRTLESQTPFGSGRHVVVWNGRDDHGRTVASGVYVVRLGAGDQSASRRIALLK